MPNRPDFHSLSGVHWVRGRRLLRDKVMLYSNDLVNSVAETSHFLTTFM